MWNASHLAVRLCALRHWKRVSMPPTTQSLRHPEKTYENRFTNTNNHPQFTQKISKLRSFNKVHNIVDHNLVNSTNTA